MQKVPPILVKRLSGLQRFAPVYELQHRLQHNLGLDLIAGVNSDRQQRNQFSKDTILANSLQQSYKHAGKEVILMTEHLPTFTAGRRLANNQDSQALEWTRQFYAEHGADYVTTNRGGKLTFHGPGQLVVYPILNLSNLRDGTCQPGTKRPPTGNVRCYVYDLESVVMRACQDGYGIQSRRAEDLMSQQQSSSQSESINQEPSHDRSALTGVWIQKQNNHLQSNNYGSSMWKCDKIAALGINVSPRTRRTSHGFSLNCNMDIDRWYSLFDPCGFKYKKSGDGSSDGSNYGITSISAEIGRNVPVSSELMDIVTRSFSSVFNRQLVDAQEADPDLSADIDKFLQTYQTA
ncbi:hypothetical protein MIR68_005682 [Amoeboaphelidium protococcarum]|nr:hypothetical protein MIR68_005682 [Amoeboaphelidium protococcarum]